MALELTDTASSLLYWLKNSPNAAAIRLQVMGGKDNILEAGDLDIAVLKQAEESRRTPANTGKILVITVHDAGEEGDEDGGTQHVIIRLFDRDCGYRNIRTVRDLIRMSWRYDFSLPAVTVGETKAGFLHLAFVGRTGYRRSMEYATDFEAITYSSHIVVEEDD